MSAWVPFPENGAPTNKITGGGEDFEQTAEFSEHFAM
jgi:hypothetical protein